MSRIFVIFLLLFGSIQLQAQIFPAEGAIVNYRLVGFSFPETKGAAKYKLEIAKGRCGDDAAFKKNLIWTQTATTNRITGELPAFGAEYTWRVSPVKNGVTANTTDYHRFSIGMVGGTDTNAVKLKIHQKALKYADAYVFLDASRTLYNMRGEAIWYLPEMNPALDTNSIRDLKLTESGTITFLAGQQAMEVSYDGNILWKAPDSSGVNGERHENYHHEFSKLKNGNYMVMGFERKKAGPVPVLPQGEHTGVRADTGAGFKFMGTVIEYDQAKRIKWSWKLADHDTSNIAFEGDLHTPTGYHQNAFYFDEERRELYVGFRNISSIWKIKYPEGNILHIYQGRWENLFCGEHSIRLSPQGNIYVYNNACYISEHPKLVMMKQDGTDTLRRLWEYECPVEGGGDNPNRRYSSGGYAAVLPDGSVFASTNSPSSRIFIVSPEKKMLWDAEALKKEANSGWNAMPQYRTSMVPGKKELEKLLWQNRK